MTPQDLPSLTSMRFFAALMVALFHACVWSSVPLGPFRYGFVGVTFFYILSGFVLTWTWRPHDSLRFFYLRRFARVYPLHLLTAMIALAFAALGVRGEGEVSPLTALLNLALLQAWVPDLAVVGALNGPSWSLSNEAFFYAVFPLLVGLLLSARLGPAIGVLGALGWLVVGGLVTVRFFPNLDWFLYV